MAIDLENFVVGCRTSGSAGSPALTISNCFGKDAGLAGLKNYLPDPCFVAGEAGLQFVLQLFLKP